MRSGGHRVPNALAPVYADVEAVDELDTAAKDHDLSLAIHAGDHVAEALDDLRFSLRTARLDPLASAAVGLRSIPRYLGY